MEHGLDMLVLAVVSACVVAWSMVSGRLERWSISAPLAFVILGLAVTHGPVHLVEVNPHSSTILSLAEVTLALVLFTDASRVNVHQLRRDLGLPVRLLAIGLPLTIGLGTAAGVRRAARHRYLGGGIGRGDRGAHRRRARRHHHGGPSHP